jgi:hypothetical protein
VEGPFWKRLWTCRKKDNRMNELHSEIYSSSPFPLIIIEEDICDKGRKLTEMVTILTCNVRISAEGVK